MEFSLLPFLFYAFATTFSPGPNNITSMTLSINFGFRKTVKFIIGNFIGFIIMMLMTGLASERINVYFPRYAGIMKWIGAAYIIYLAVLVLLTKEVKNGKFSGEPSYRKGFFLQMLNPKVILYGLTIFPAFILPVYNSALAMVLFALLLASFALTSISLWAGLGSIILRYVKNSRVLRWINLIMAGLLIYTAYSILVH